MMHIDELLRSSVGASAKRSAYQYFAPTADYGFEANTPDTRRARFIVATADLSAPVPHRLSRLQTYNPLSAPTIFLVDYYRLYNLSPGGDKGR
jgi:hypothetical protein